MTAREREKLLSAPLDFEPPQNQAAARVPGQPGGVLAELQSGRLALLNGEKLQLWGKIGKFNSAALGNMAKHGKEQLVEQRKQGPGAGSIPGETAMCFRVKFNQFPTLHVRFCPKMRQNLVSLPSRNHRASFPSQLKKKKKRT